MANPMEGIGVERTDPVHEAAEREGREPPEQDAEQARLDAELVRKWLAALDDARKREKNFRKLASEIIDLYEGEESKRYQFNILYSNTETLKPAVYSNVPRPVVRYRLPGENPIAVTGAKVMERMLSYLMDTNSEEYATFDDVTKGAVLDALVPGRGAGRYQYDFSVATMPVPEGAPPGTQPAEQVTYETVCSEEVSWDRLLYGYARKWSKVPWLSIEHFLDREEAKKLFDDETVALLKFTATTKDADGTANLDADTSSSTEADSEATVHLAQVFEIWDKSKREVVFLSPQTPARPLKIVPDPLGLTGFYNVPKPIMFLAKVKNLVPTPLYKQYKAQHDELNKITERINKLIDGLRLRGMYDARVKGIEALMEAGDNVMVPVEDMIQLQDMNQLEKVFWFMPIDKIAAVLSQLYLQRQQIKQVIFEITGIADILRGSSQASETATAQQIKSNWGKVRITDMQSEVSRYCRDSLRIMAEIGVNKLAPATLAQITGVNLFQTPEEKQMAMEQVQSVAGTAQLTGQPPPPPPPELQEKLSSPTWAEVMALLQNDQLRSYTIDVETNSTLAPEASEDQEQIGQFMNAIAQFFNAIAPLIESGTMDFEVAKSMLLAVTRRYRFGNDVEEHLKKMQAPQAKGEDPKAKTEAMKMEMEMAMQKEEMAMKREEMAMKREQMTLQHQIKMRELQAANQAAILKAQLAQVTPPPAPAPAVQSQSRQRQSAGKS